ncbi:MAG: hypothetical protein Q4A75_05830 [Peptostreptococcaceae bacterium]|nr:hypothetical protein [Peptostreptococcaceae bacterium]
MKKFLVILTLLLLMTGTAYAYWTDKVELKLEAAMVHSVHVQVVGGGGCRHKKQLRQEAVDTAPSQGEAVTPVIPAPEAEAAGSVGHPEAEPENVSENAPTTIEQEADDGRMEAAED